MTELLREFGFTAAELSPQLFLEKDRIIRMGIPPFRIEVLTGTSGVNFDECYAARIVGDVDDVDVNIISLPHLKANKKASGRLKDLADVQHLP